MKIKNLFKFMAATLCVGVVAFGAGCTTASATLLGEAAQPYTVTVSARQSETYKSVKSSAESFAAQFSEAVYNSVDGDGENLAVSPVSVYMALALASECTDGNTQAQILSALDIDGQTLSEGFADFYCSLMKETTGEEGDIVSRLSLSNSVWVTDGLGVKDNCISTLANNYYCYSYAADFQNDNEAANQAIRDFVKEQTYGLIDQQFGLSNETLFALINTLYLKDVWNSTGSDMSFTDDSYDFANADGTTTRGKLLSGYYVNGRAQQGDNYSFFYTKTYSGYNIKFMVPDEGYSVGDIYTAENIAYMNGVSNYGYGDTENKIHYHTRCFFPEFTAEYDNDLKSLLSASFGIDDLFSAYCDFGNLTDAPAYCSKVSHVVKLEVNKKGIEGAAVTVMAGSSDSAPDSEYTDVYEDFIMDKAFAYVVTDSYGVTLFSGVVNKV